MVDEDVRNRMLEAEQAKRTASQPATQNLALLYDLMDSTLGVLRSPAVKRGDVQSAKPLVTMLGSLVTAGAAFGDNMERAEIPDGFFDRLNQDERRYLFCLFANSIVTAAQENME